MLPPGHVAGGYLASLAVLKLIKPDLSLQEINQLILLGTFFGFAPDLDMFVAFAKVKSFTIQAGKVSHRLFVSHAPLVWLVIGLATYFLASDPFLKMVGITIWIGSFSHFVLDSFEYGVIWLWPFSKKLFAFKDRGVKEKIETGGFFSYWWRFVEYYTTKVSFYLEIVIIIVGITIFINN